MTAAGLVLAAALLSQAAQPADFGELVVTVTDANGQLVEGLEAPDFVLEVGGIAWPIARLSEGSAASITIGLLVDVSGSMSNPGRGLARFAAAKAAARIALDTMMRPGDTFTLMSFAGSFSVLEDFTPDREEIEREVPDLSRGGGTELVDALGSALGHMRDAPDTQHAMILLTDGVFSGALEPSAAQARRGEIPVFAIGVDAHSPDSGSIYSTLDAMAAESGGRTHAFPIHAETAISDLVRFFEEVETRVRGQYTLGYRRPDTSMPSPLHAVRIRTLDPELRVAVRPATVLTR
jgi:VWFA-related protein